MSRAAVQLPAWAGRHLFYEELPLILASSFPYHIRARSYCGLDWYIPISVLRLRSVYADYTCKTCTKTYQSRILRSMTEKEKT